MFSFFKKKSPATAPSAERADETSSTVEATALTAESGGERSRGKLDWLNADVGELFFGKKPVASQPASPSVATAGPSANATPAAPPANTTNPPVPVRPAGAPESQARSGEAAAVPTAETAADRSGWMAKLRDGLQRTGGAIAGAFVGAEIGDELYEDLEVALL
ncbi:MAG: hypothetical protein ABI990_12425, partial [Actinomycetota bacterium]